MGRRAVLDTHIGWFQISTIGKPLIMGNLKWTRVIFG